MEKRGEVFSDQRPVLSVIQWRGDHHLSFVDGLRVSPHNQKVTISKKRTDHQISCACLTWSGRQIVVRGFPGSTGAMENQPPLSIRGVFKKLSTRGSTPKVLEGRRDVWERLEVPEGAGWPERVCEWFGCIADPESRDGLKGFQQFEDNVDGMDHRGIVV